MSSWKKKMRVKWSRNLDGVGTELPLERHGSLRKPKEINKLPEEGPFKRSWSFRLGSGGNKDTVEQAAVKDGDRHNVLLRLFRFRDKKRQSDGRNCATDNRRPSAPSVLPVPGQKRTSDAVRASSVDLQQWASVPSNVNGSVPQLDHQQELCQWGSVPSAIVTGDAMRSRTLPGVRSSPLLTDKEDDVGAILGVIYCAPEATKTLLDHGKSEGEVGKVKLAKAEALKLPRPVFLGKPARKAFAANGTGPGKAATDETTMKTVVDASGKDCAESELVGAFSKAVAPHFIHIEEDGERREPLAEGVDVKVLLLNGSERPIETIDIEDCKKEEVVGLVGASSDNVRDVVSLAEASGSEENDEPPTLGLEGGSLDAQNKTAPSIPHSADVPEEIDREPEIKGVGDTQADFRDDGRESDVHDDDQDAINIQTDQHDGHWTGTVLSDSFEGHFNNSVHEADDSNVVSEGALNRTFVLEPDQSADLPNDFEATILEEKTVSSILAVDDAAGCEGDSQNTVASCDGEGADTSDRDEKVADLHDYEENTCVHDGVVSLPPDSNSPCNVTNIFIDSAGPKVDDFVTCVEVDPSRQTLTVDVQEPVPDTLEEGTAPLGEDLFGDPSEKDDVTCDGEDTMQTLNPLKSLCDIGSLEDGSTPPESSEESQTDGSRSDMWSSSTSRDASPEASDLQEHATVSDKAVDVAQARPPVQEEAKVSCEDAGIPPLQESSSEREDNERGHLEVQQVPSEEASFQEKLDFFDSISSPARGSSDASRRSFRLSRIPLPSRLPRPTCGAKQDTPGPAKRLRTLGLPPNTKSSVRLESDDLIAKRSEKLPKNALGETPQPSRPDLEATFACEASTELASVCTSQRLQAAKEVMKTSSGTRRIPSRIKPQAKRDRATTRPQNAKVPPSNRECSRTAGEKLSAKALQSLLLDAGVPAACEATPGGLVRSRTFVREEDEEAVKSTGTGGLEDATAANVNAVEDVSSRRPDPVATERVQDRKDTVPQDDMPPVLADKVLDAKDIAENAQEEVSAVNGPNDDTVLSWETVLGIGARGDASHHAPPAREAKHASDLVVAIMDSVQVPVVDSTSTVGDVVQDTGTFQTVKTPNSTLKVPAGVSGRNKAGGDARTGHPLTRAEFTKEIQRLGALCEARTKEANFLKLQLKHASTGFAAFSILLKHLTEQHDVFSIPHLTKELEKSRQEIDRAHATIEQYKRDIEDLKRKQLEEIEAMKEKVARERALQLEELEAAHKNEISYYTESHAKKTEELKAFYTGVIEGDRKSHEDAIDALREKHREKIEAINEEYTIQLDAINDEHAAQQAQLEAKHAALMDQYRTLQEQAREFQSSVLLDTDSKIQWLSKKNADLEKEVDSLNVVLEMRAEQIQALQRSKLEMERKEEELERCKDRIQKLEARNEDLQELLNEKAKLQSQLSFENAVLREKSEKQNRQLSRLDMTNEQLKYKLRESAGTSFTYERGSTKPRANPPKRLTVCDPTAMSRSWHSDRPGAARKTPSLRSHHRSLTLPNNHRADGRRVRRSMSDSVPNAECLRTRLCSTDEEEDTSFGLENSAGQRSREEDLLHLTWICSSEGSDNSRVSDQYEKSPNRTASSSSESGGSLPDPDGLSNASLLSAGEHSAMPNGSAAFGRPSPRSLAGEATVAEETAGGESEQASGY